MTPDLEAMMANVQRLPRRYRYQFFALMFMLLANAEVGDE